MQSKKSFCIVLLKWQEQHTCPPVCNCIKFLIIYVCSIHIMCKSVEYMARNIVMMNLFPTFIFCPFLASTTYHGNASMRLSYFCYILFVYTLIYRTKSDQILFILGHIYVPLTGLPWHGLNLFRSRNHQTNDHALNRDKIIIVHVHVI